MPLWSTSVLIWGICWKIGNCALCQRRMKGEIILTIVCRILGDLEDDLLCELDAVCQDNQLTCYPVSRGRNSEDYIFEMYPEIVSLVERDRKRRIDSMKLRSRLNRVELYDEERLRPVANEKTPVSPTPRKTKATPVKETPNMTQSPALASKQSTSDLMFQMDEEASLSPGVSMKGKATVRGIKSPDFTNGNRAYFGSLSPAMGSSLVEGDSLDERSYLDDHMASAQNTPLAESPSQSRAVALQQKRDSLSPADPLSSGAPWGSPAIPTSKKDLKDIMAEASQSRVSNLTLGMSGRRDGGSNFAQKLSQKERKKLQQQQMQEKLAVQQKAKEAPQNPWQSPAANKSTPVIKTGPLSGGVNGENKPITPEPVNSSQKPSMTLRQTIAGASSPSRSKTEPTTTTPVQSNLGRNVSVNNVQSPSRPSTAATRPAAPSTPGPSTSPNFPTISQQPTIQSIRHIPRQEPYQTGFHSHSSNSMSLATILLQQQTEKEELREAATAKHNLQDIQAEQAFQEWWDKESKRVMELAEAEAEAAAAAAAAGKTGRGRGSGGGRGKGQDQGQGQGASTTPRRRRPKGPGNNITLDGSGSTQQQQSSAPGSGNVQVQKALNGRGENQNRASGKKNADDARGNGNTGRRGGRGNPRSGKGKEGKGS